MSPDILQYRGMEEMDFYNDFGNVQPLFRPRSEKGERRVIFHFVMVLSGAITWKYNERYYLLWHVKDNVRLSFLSRSLCYWSRRFDNAKNYSYVYIKKKIPSLSKSSGVTGEERNWKFTTVGYSEGGIGGLSTPQHTAEKNDKHRITKKVAKHWHRNFNFGPTINLIQIST